MAGSLRQSEGFRRYALSIQYYGTSLLGFSYQKDIESNLGLCGAHSVQGRLMVALDRLLGSSEFYENIQVSSRTDRGVHAIKNTLHIDLKPSSARQQKHMDPKELLNGINHHLGRLENTPRRNIKRNGQRTQRLHEPYRAQVRLINAKFAPEKMYNPYSVQYPDQPEYVDWNARFSATRRTYVYRVLIQGHFKENGIVYEWDRAWQVNKALNVFDMQEAAQHLVGLHDFTSFRSAGCKRFSPEVHLSEICIQHLPYSILGIPTDSSTTLVVITITGNAFLYRQVRNIVGCLVTVGKGEVTPQEVKDILEQKNRECAPMMAPAHGLFLIDVQHGGFVI